MSDFPTCRDFTFKVKAKITTQLSQMKANERARKLEKSSDSIFINALAYWFQWIQVYFPILSNPAPCIEPCRAGERVSKSHNQYLSLAWPLWCSMSVGREGNHTEFSFLKCRMETLAGLTSLDSWEDELQSGRHVKSYCVSSLSPSVLTPSPRENSSHPSKHSSNSAFQGELFPDPPLTSQSVTYSSHVACHLFYPGVLYDSPRHQHFLFLTQSDGNRGPFQ